MSASKSDVECGKVPSTPGDPGGNAKIFRGEATIRAEANGFGLFLDRRLARTPAKAPLIIPTAALAEALATEWQEQSGAVRPADMPLTRAANTAIDRVTPHREAVVTEIVRFGETDLLCYRAGQPQALAARQAAAWDPLLAWAGEVLDAPLRTTRGLTPCLQPQASLDALRTNVSAHDPWQLTALHDLTALSGSVVIGLAVSHGRIDADAAWVASRVDEDWNIEQWGEDAEAEASATRKWQAFENAARLLQLLSQ